MDTQLYDTLLQVAEDKRNAQPESELANEKLDMVVRSLTEQTKAIKDLASKISSKVEVTNLPEPIEHDDSAVVQAIAKVQHLLERDNDQAQVEALNRILSELKNVPKELPEASTIDLLPIQASIEAGNQQLLEAIKALKLAPKITVPEPTVTVQPTDTKSIVKAVEAVKRAVDIKPTPVANTPTDPLIKYTAADIDDAGAVQYFGYTDTSGAWYIRKFDTSVSPKTIRFAFGQSGYATGFANRASLTYAVWGS